MPSTRKSKPSCVRPGRGIDFLKKRRPSSRRNLDKNTIRVHPPRRRQLPDPFDVPLSGWCRIQAITPGATGVCQKPGNTVEELANFCDVSSSRELRTNPPVVDVSAKSWSAGGVATSPEGRCAGSCSLEGLEGVSHPAPRPTTTVPAADLAGRPDLIERNFTADAPVPETGG